MPLKRGSLEIPPHISPLLSQAQRKRTLDTFQKRSLSMESRLSATSSVNEFIDLKVEEVEEYIRCYTGLKQDIFESFRCKQITERQYEDGLQDLQNKLSEFKNEESVLKKQRKLLEEDIADEMPRYSDVEEAYRNILLSKVMAASNSQSQKKQKFDKSTFRRKVKDFYGSSRDTEDQGMQSFCVVFGWLPQGLTSAAHLVPKSLNSGELQHLFGVDDNSMLSDPRDAIPLHKNLETALDLGNIVIAPVDAAMTGMELKWKLLVTNKSHLSRNFDTNTKWGEIHGKELQWINSNRPAKRFLYFRFIATYLICKAKGKPTDWVNEVAANGKMWCTPGPYLRRSMLKLLSKECDDNFLPEVFYEEQTFSGQGQGKEQEVANARELRDDMMLSAKAVSDSDSEDTDEELEVF